ncbi:MAG TPA: helix-turn-helix transcriptional regulator [Gemmataceae bacterium]|jgi:transcriptional regulator with XRE-family HTH domain
MVTEPVPNIGKRVRQLRIDRGLSQQALATAAGLSISVVTTIEQGQRDDPRISTVVALARALGIGVDALLSDAAPSDSAPAKRTRKRKGE